MPRVDFKLIVKVLKFARKPEERIRREILERLPPEVRGKVDNMLRAYELAMKGEMDRDEAVKVIAKELHMENTDEVMELIRDVMELLEDMLKQEEGQGEEMVKGKGGLAMPDEIAAMAERALRMAQAEGKE